MTDAFCNELLDVADRKGRGRAMEVAREWIERGRVPAGDPQSAARTFVAIRALPGLAAGDPALEETSYDLLIQLLDDRARPADQRTEAVAALFGFESNWGAPILGALYRDDDVAPYEPCPDLSRESLRTHSFRNRASADDAVVSLLIRDALTGRDDNHEVSVLYALSIFTPERSWAVLGPQLEGLANPTVVSDGLAMHLHVLSGSRLFWETGRMSDEDLLRRIRHDMPWISDSVARQVRSAVRSLAYR